MITQINGNTQINFTVKSFFALIFTILGLFYGFYQLVIVSKIEKTEEHYETIFKDQKEQNRIFYEELGKINNSIGSLNASIEALNKSKNNETQNNIANTGGSFGGNIASR
jgi:hypothetical protein